MEHFRLRKYRGPEIWAKVREAYVAGEPGPQVAKRFDVGLANLRKKALREGWTRTAAARASDPLILATQPDLLASATDTAPSPDPGVARDAAIARAAALLAEGRAAEATALVKAADALDRMVEARVSRPAAGPPSPPLPTPEEDAKREADARAEWDGLMVLIETRAAQLALDMLEDDCRVGVQHVHFAARWRAEFLGPDVEERDRRRAEDGGWADRYYDAHARLRSREVVADSLWATMRGRMRRSFGLTWLAPIAPAPAVPD